MITALLIGAALNISTPVHCHTTGERWNDTRSMEELIEIGAYELCNGGGIREGSRITDEQRQTVNTVIVSALVIASAVKRRQ